MGIDNSEKIGKLGEDITVKYLKGRGFSIIERNFLRKYGEIDVVCEKEGKLHFIEVKSVSRITSPNEEINDIYRPEDNLHSTKILRLKRVISAYLSMFPDQREFSFHLVTVKIDVESKIARVAMSSEIIL